MSNELPLEEIPGKLVLVGVAGSRAFGLATADSDVDLRGCYIVPSRELFRLITPPESFVWTKPDVSLHEIGKLIRLAAGANPTALETLSYSEYVVNTPIGQLLLENRDLFITEKIRNTHLGFARQQFDKMLKRKNDFLGDNARRAAKHARHTLRVVRLTERVLATGEYSLVVDNPDEIFAFGELPLNEMISKAQYEIERITALPSVLPPGPDLEAIDDLLILIREGFYNV